MTIRPPVPEAVQPMSMNSKGSPRLVARVAHRDTWFPDGLTEVVAHTDGRYLSVTLTGVSSAPGKAWVAQFACDEREACLAELREWLRCRGSEGNAHAPQHIASWSAEVASRLIDALHRQHAT